MLQAIADVHIDLAMKLADVLKQVWAEADRWNVSCVCDCVSCCRGLLTYT